MLFVCNIEELRGPEIRLAHTCTHAHTQHIVPPDQAHALTVENTEATSIHISWRPPTLATLHPFYYLINANNLNGTYDTKQANTTNTFFNVTGLLPGTTYELTVVTVYEGGGGENVAMSQPSNSAIATTEFTGTVLNSKIRLVPNLLCFTYYMKT